MNPNKSIFSTFNEIVEEILRLMPEDAKNVLSDFKEDNLISLHHSFGQDIRNDFYLWNPSHPLTKGYETDKDPTEPKHPDTVSFEIIKAIYRKLQGD